MNQQLQDYIKQSRIAGLSDDQIKQKLLEANWSESDIDESFNNNFDTNAKSPDSNRIRVDYNIKKSKKGLYITLGIIVVILIIGSISYYFVYQQNRLQQDIIKSAINDKYSEFLENGGKYKNNLLGYEIEYGSSWRIAIEFNRQIAAMGNLESLVAAAGCDRSIDLSGTDIKSSMDKYIDCFKKNPSIAKKSIEFQNNWDVENSDIVILTQLSKERELEFINSDKGILDYPGKTIQIFPSFIDTYPSKEGGIDKIQIKYYEPIDGNKAYIIDHKDSGYGRSLEVYILHELDYYIEIEEKMAKSLEIQTDIDEGSDLEQDFYKIVNSLHFIE